MALRFRDRLGHFASRLGRGTSVWSEGHRIGGAARAAALKAAQVRKRARRRKRRPPKKFPDAVPKRYHSPFAAFLKPLSALATGSRARIFALVVIRFAEYEKFKERIIPIPLGSMTGRQALEVTKADVKAALKLSHPERASNLKKVLGVYALRGRAELKRGQRVDPTRKTLSKKLLRV